jgi:hypothetical protein
VKPPDPFQTFRRTFERWAAHTAALPLSLGSPESPFELDLDHLIGYVSPIAIDAAEGSTQYDYPNVAAEYLDDINQIRSEFEQARLTEAARHTYATYLDEFSHLLTELAALPMPAEGHLGFRGAALRAFNFLIAEYGFEVTESSPITVTFTYKRMRVCLTHSPQYPPGTVDVGLNSSDGGSECAFVLDDFDYVTSGHIVFDYDVFDLSNPKGIERFLQAAASLIRSSGNALLKGDMQAWRDFQKRADERDRAYTRMMERDHGFGDP